MTSPAISPAYAVIAAEGSYAVQRNGVTIKTPAKEHYIVPTQALAEAIAAEWRAQKPNKLDTASMPMTQLAATCIDIVRKDRQAAVDQTVAYAANELLAYRAEHPDTLVAQQAKLWQPLLDWAETHFGAKLNTGHGIMPIKQSAETFAAFRKAVDGYDDFALTGLKHAVEVSGSLVLGLSLIERHLSAEQMFHAAELDAAYQAGQWGDDPVTAERHKSIRNDLTACEQWFTLLR